MQDWMLESSYKHTCVIIHLAARAHCSFPTCMERSCGSGGLWPLLWHAATAPVMWRNMNHTSTPGFMTYTSVNVPAHSQAYRWSQSRSGISFDLLYNAVIYLLTNRHALRYTCTGVRWSPVGQLQARTRPCSGNETLPPLDLLAVVALNSAYIPSVPLALLCAPLSSPALIFYLAVH